MINNKLLYSPIVALALFFAFLCPVGVLAEEPAHSGIGVSVQDEQMDSTLEKEKVVDLDVAADASSEIEITAKTAEEIEKEALEAEIKNNSQSLAEEAKKLYGFDVLFSGDYAADAIVHKKAEKKKVEILAQRIREAHPESIPGIEAFALSLKEARRKEYLSYGLEAKELVELDKELSKDPSVDFVIHSLINKWNAWPNGSLGKAMQVAVLRKYNLYNSSLDQWKKDDLREYDPHLEAISVVMEEMKNFTLKTLQEKGVTHLTLYRGLKLPEKMENQFHTHRLSALSSFSLSYETAKLFSIGAQDGYYSYILAKKFPIERIFCYGLTGFGPNCEYEFVVMGPQFELDNFYVIVPKFEHYEYNYDDYSHDYGKAMKKPKFHKWVDYGYPKAVDKAELKLKPTTNQKINVSNVTEKTSSKSGIFATILTVLGAVWTFLVDVVNALIEFVKSWFR